MNTIENRANDRQFLDAFLATARHHACPDDQIENFIRSGAIIQPKQLQAAARLPPHWDRRHP